MTDGELRNLPGRFGVNELTAAEMMDLAESVDHPSHYGGDTVYEAIKVIEAWGLDFCLGNTVKYISRAGKKNPGRTVEDLEKAAWYLNRALVKAKGFLPDKPIHNFVKRNASDD